MALHILFTEWDEEVEKMAECSRQLRSNGALCATKVLNLSLLMNAYRYSRQRL